MGEQPKFMTIREAARTKVVPEHFLRLMVAQGKCPGIYAGKKFMVNYGLLLEQLDAESRRGGVAE